MLFYTLEEKKYKNIVLLVFSLIFYAWGGPKYLLLLLADTFVSWYCAIRIESKKNLKKLYLTLDIIFMLGVLGIFKYLNFFVGNLNYFFSLFPEYKEIVLPIGISFYTFQLISYDVDVYRGKVKAQKVFWKLLLYSSLFHQCIAGPIVRYETVAKEIEKRKVTITDIEYGIRRFTIGLAKKAVLANSIGAIVDKLLPSGVQNLQAQPMVGVWLGAFLFYIQLYLDFSAYSDMAIGMGRMVGFHYLENFNYPIISKSIQEFWRRWHISLSSFFRDYVYIPLGGNRVSNAKYIRNLFIVWFLTGFWHGASWNYIFWGLYHFTFLLLEKYVFKGYLKKYKGIPYLYTVIVVTIGFVIFKFEDLSELGTVLLALIGFSKGGFINLAVWTQIKKNIFLIIFSVIACTPFGKQVERVLNYLSKTGNPVLFFGYNVTRLVLIPLLLFLSFIALIGNTYNPFLYFQF